MSQLTNEQAAALQSLQEIAQVADDQLCLQVLQQNGWNVEQAVNTLVGQQVDHHGGRDDYRQAVQPGQAGRGGRGANNNLVPVNATNVAEANTSSGFGLFDFLFVPLRWLFQSQPLSLNADADSERFVDDLTRRHPGHVDMVTTSYQTTVQNAFNQSKFILVYLHSPLHEDSEAFCSAVLCSPALAALCGAQGQAVLWGGRVWDPEAYALTIQLRVSAFPCLVLLVAQSSGVVRVVDKLQGLLDPAEICARLQRGIAAFSEIVRQTRQESDRRSEAVRLRAEQDREYHESMQREAEAMAAARAAEEARQAAAQAEELAAAVAMSQELARGDEMRRLKAAVQALPEPPDGPAAAAIRFQLPNGKKLARRFGRQEPIQRVVDYLKVVLYDDGDVTRSFSVSTNYPKVELVDMAKTVEEMGLAPRSMLFVQDLDA